MEEKKNQAEVRLDEYANELMKKESIGKLDVLKKLEEIEKEISKEGNEHEKTAEKQ